MKCDGCPESKLILGGNGPAEMVMDPDSETCKGCMDEQIGEIMERHRGSLDMLAKDDGLVLKPCPFCGASAEYTQYSYDHPSAPCTYHLVRCTECCAKVETTTTAADAMEQWNRRVKE